MLTDTTILSELDFEISIACEQDEDDNMQEFKCPNKAEWKCVCVCCGTTEFFCDQCRLMILSWMNGDGWICGHCEFDAGHGVAPWISVERLGS